MNQDCKNEIKFLSYGSQSIDANDIASVVDSLKSEFLTNGTEVKNFEDELSLYTGSKFCSVSSSGTSSLHLAVKALDIGPGDLVIVPGITFLASANAVKYEGAEIIFADIDPYSGLITPETIKNAILSVDNKSKIKAIINVHVAGHVSDIQGIYRLAKEHGLKLIDDAAHALGTIYYIDNKSFAVGSCSHCDITTFSFHPLKNITTCEGGAITTNDENIYNKVQYLRNHGMCKQTNMIKNSKAFDNDGKVLPWYYEMIDLGFNYRLSDIHCALGRSQLRKIGTFKDHRKKMKEKYDMLFSDMEYIVPLSSNYQSSPMWHLYVILIDFEKLSITRECFVKKLLNNKIGTQVHWTPLYYHPYYQKNVSKDLSGCEYYYNRCLSIPLHTQMDENDVERVIFHITEIINQ